MDGKVQRKALNFFECGGIERVHHREVFWSGEQDAHELVIAGLAERLPVTIDFEARAVALDDVPAEPITESQPLLTASIAAINPNPRRVGRPPRQPIE